MNAAEFNRLYPVGTILRHESSSQPVRGGRLVRTVGRANDFKCGCVVEINVEPYFAKAKDLKPA